MPTGYTAGVGDGSITTLRAFALLCARAFGATVTMRDDPMDAQIPEHFEPRDYHRVQLEDARRKLAQISALSAEECEALAQAEFAQNEASWREYEAELQAQNQRYHRMISEVEAWETKAEGIKDFMLQQLRVSIRSGPSIDPPGKKSGAEWRAITIKVAEDDIAYYAKEYAEEVARVEGRNRWLADLRASLPAEKAPQ